MIRKYLRIVIVAIALTLVAMLALSLPGGVFGSQSAVVQADTCYEWTSCQFLQNEDCSDDQCDQIWIFASEFLGQPERFFKGYEGSPGYDNWIEDGSQIECYRYRYCVRNPEIDCEDDDTYKQLMNPPGSVGFFIKNTSSILAASGPC